MQAASAVGIASAALAASIAFANGSLQPPDRPPALIEVWLADIQAKLDAARLFTLDAARRKRLGQPARELLVMAKIYATEMAVRVCDGTMRLCAARGYAAD
ncbi:hypothetical protein KXS07_36935 [Inquilinus limosus]